MAGTATGTCTITRLRNGDIIYATFLFSRATSVAYDDTAIIGGFDEDALFVDVQFTSASGRPVSLVPNKVSWLIDDTDVETLNYGTVDYRTGTLEITSNGFMDAGLPMSHICMFNGQVSVGGVKQDVSRTFEITMISSGGNSYWGTIVPKGSTVLSNDNQSVVLEPSLRKGGLIVDASQYSVKWFNNDSEVTSNITSKKLTVTRDIVNGASLIRCEFYSKDGVLLEADGLTVLDVADEYQIVLNSEYQVQVNGEIQITPKIYSETKKQFVNAKWWTAEVRNSYTLENISTGWSIDSGTGVFTMRESNMYYVPAESDPNYVGEGKRIEYNPIVIFTAEI